MMTINQVSDWISDSKKVKGEITLVVQGKVRNTLTPDPSGEQV